MSIEPPRIRRRSSLLASVERIRSVAGNLWLNNLLVYLYVCENEGVSVSELAYASRLPLATASRAVRSLAPRGERYALAPALGLVRQVRNPADGRGRLLVLTEAGRDLRAQLENHIAEATPILVGGGDLRSLSPSRT